ncbi:MAG TPA: saccharopine dehydrogenase NADP-binding domain-containing protein [Ruminococcus sp.]|mgnify:CR=1 FL=1|nr:saccharopine dehydrogenase NADP-binding domain-containing protein [Ruminococcus sp.]
MVGILGGYGDIGRNVTAFLEKYSDEKIRIGSRHPERKLSGEHSDRISYEYVDITDIESVKRFINGCNAVVNCTGCNDDNVVAAADAVSAAGCGYIDLCMNEKLKAGGKGKVVYGCGSIPGLAELMMLYLGREFEKPEDMNFIYGALGNFSLTAAQDYLEGVLKSSSRSMVCLKNGKVTECESLTELEQRFPFTEEKCMMFPYIDEGALYAASELGLCSGSWYMAFAGNRTLQALENASAVYTKDRNSAVQALSTASELDCAEKGKFVGILIEITGIINKEGDRGTKTLYLRCDDPSRLTGSVAAASLLALGKDILPEGAYPLYKCGQPERFIKYLENFQDVFRIFIADGDRSVFMEEIEGEI